MDGWDDDDDALAGLNDDDEEGKKEEEENGWGDNDDGLEDLSVDDNGDNGGCRSVVPLNLSATGAPATTTGPVDPATHRRASELSAKTVLNPNVKRAATATTGISGWELETEGTVWNDSTHSSVVAKEIRRSLPPIVDMTPAVDGWDDEDDLELDDDDDDDAPATVPLKHILTLEQDALYQKLQLYIQRLPHLVTSLNAVLEAEYNTTTHTMALLEYYAHRPQLMAYTVDVEVPRMDYRVKTRDGRILTDKLLVQKHFKSQPNSILLRASNQSLLADILTVLQGDVICPQFLATAICTSCQFRMDDSTVDVECSMSLSLPNATGARMNVATMLCHVMLDPTEPMVMYQIKQIVPAMDNHHDTTATLLQGTAMFLSEMACGMDDTNGMDSSSSSSSQPTTADALRDQCLHQLAKTHYMAQQTSTGLSSALRQIDRVANVSNKVTALSKLIPTLPHATDLLHSEEQSPVNVATASQQRNNRPKPILGGFLMSGLSRLANTIVPDDSPEPSFYRKEESQAPMLYRKEEAKGAPSLYRKDEMHTLAPQALYRQPDPPQRPAPRQNVEPPPPIPPAVQDGWDEDDEELNFDDDDDNGNKPVTKPLFESPARPVLSNMAAVTTPSNPSSYTSSATLEKPTLLNPPPPRPGRPTVSHGTFGGRTTNSQPPPPPPPPPPPVSKLPVSHGTFSGRTTIVKNSNLDPPLHVVVLEEDEDLVAPIPHQDYPPIPPPMLHYDPNDDIIPTRVRWTRSR